jgi:uncharacterized BrkB/YihY/UPF0761 family membrane protein
MITNLTLTQEILIYVLGFFASLTIFKYAFKYKRANRFPRNGEDDHVLDMTIFSIVWMLTIPVLVVLVIFVLIYRFCKWYLEL